MTLRHARFDSLPALLDELGHDQISGCLFDLGVSSPQLDHAERGFSYRLDGPLDMRMDQTGGVTAADIVNHADEGDLAEMLRNNADERHCRRIARAIVAGRPFSTTTQLARAIAEGMPSASGRRAHPARRTFQALRIEVNAELEVLEASLTSAIDRLAATGRCVVLSYHSGEDRIVKNVLRNAAGESRLHARGFLQHLDPEPRYDSSVAGPASPTRLRPQPIPERAPRVCGPRSVCPRMADGHPPSQARASQGSGRLSRRAADTLSLPQAR